MADILVRLWSPSLDAMRRVMAECKMSDRSKLDETSKAILPNFPPNLHSLGFTNLHKTFRELRKPAPFPLGTANLPWHGSWVKRWSGTESDLFYVFAKCYHILITDFLPEGTTAAERLCAPGLVMVHAQILANMDETLHRHAALTAAKEEESLSTSSMTFDDVLADGPDAAASALPLPPANAVRLMAENRLIMLLRDFLSSAYGNHSSLETQLGDTNIRPTSALSIASDNSDAGEEDNGKKRFSLLRNLLSVSKPRSKSRSPDPPTTREGTTNTSNSDNATSEATAKKHNTPEVPPHRSYCFRFSLEWVHDKRFANPGPMRLLPPRLPPAAHNFLHAQREEAETANPKPITSVKPEGPAITSSKYSGRALGEWAIVVGECQSFFQRRKDEGVPGNKLVETPTLGVEVFRRPG
ncbi:hypothetical protein SLS55_000170 [Diplodia seriata]|uniref:Uncharacterized protein n=1 Tax=Diplodia seriata TaxID=420778 RepID=A0ABR3CWK2_9PEZI